MPGSPESCQTHPRTSDHTLRFLSAWPHSVSKIKTEQDLRGLLKYRCSSLCFATCVRTLLFLKDTTGRCGGGEEKTDRESAIYHDHNCSSDYRRVQAKACTLDIFQHGGGTLSLQELLRK